MLYNPAPDLFNQQLAQNLSQLIQGIYLKHLGHQPSQVSCQLVDQTLTILVEGSITQTEQLLAQNGQQELAKQVRSKIHQALHTYFKDRIEEVVGVPVIDLLSDSAFETGRSSIVAVLATMPEVDNSSSSSAS